METLLEKYRAHLMSQHKEVSTLKSYVHEVESFLQWCGGRHTDLSTVTQDTLIEFRDAMIAKGAKVATVNKTVSTLSTFFKWAQNEGLAGGNFARHIRLRTDKKEAAPRWLTPDEVTALLEVVAKEPSAFMRARNEAIIYIMLFSGLRVEEVSQLRIDSVDDERLHVYDHDTVVRSVPMTEPTRLKVAAWIEFRLKAVKQVHMDSRSLFVTERSGNMQPRSIQFVVEAYEEKLLFPVTSQTLRNTFCRRLVEDGASIERLKELAGHKSVLTSFKYYGSPLVKI